MGLRGHAGAWTFFINNFFFPTEICPRFRGGCNPMVWYALCDGSSYDILQLLWGVVLCSLALDTGVPWSRACYSVSDSWVAPFSCKVMRHISDVPSSAELRHAKADQTPHEDVYYLLVCPSATLCV